MADDDLDPDDDGADDPPVLIHDLCLAHQRRIVADVGIPESSPWQGLMAMVQVTLFKAAVLDPDVCHRLGGNIHRMFEVGCLACLKPNVFDDIVGRARLAYQRAHDN